MVTCLHCDTKNNSEAKYCSHCGKKLAHHKTEDTSSEVDKFLESVQLPEKKHEHKSASNHNSSDPLNEKVSSTPFKIIGIVVVIALLIWPGIALLGGTKQITCDHSVPYQEQVAYTVQEAYQEPAPYQISSKTCTKGWPKDTLFDVYAFSRVFIINNDNNAGQFSVTMSFYTAKRGRMPYTQTQYIQPGGSAEFNFQTDVDQDEDVSCDASVTPPMITKYRTVTKYRTETKYRSESYQKTVNKIFGSC